MDALLVVRHKNFEIHLPKGMGEDDELFEKTTDRVVNEETVSQSTIIEKFGMKSSIYVHSDKAVQKTVLDFPPKAKRIGRLKHIDSTEIAGMCAVSPTNCATTTHSRLLAAYRQAYFGDHA